MRKNKHNNRNAMTSTMKTPMFDAAGASQHSHFPARFSGIKACGDITS